MKKLIALLLSVLLALTSMAPAYAAKPYLENQNFSIEASIDELADGITFAIIQEADGSLTVQKIEQSDIALQANQRVAGTFHCGLTYHKNASTAHIHWTATSSQITGVRARVYCKPTYVIGGDYGNYFFYGDIDEYRDLNQHCIVLLKFVSTESLQSNQEQAVTRYRASVIDFFEEYTQFLKSQENIE